MNRRHFMAAVAATLTAPAAVGRTAAVARDLGSGARARDVAFHPDGSIWLSLGRDRALARVDPDGGAVDLLSLGQGAAPFGLVWGPDDAFWVADAGRDAVLRVEPGGAVEALPLPAAFRPSSLRAMALDHDGVLWFGGHELHGRADPFTMRLDAWDAGAGALLDRIAVTPDNQIWACDALGGGLRWFNLGSGAATAVPAPGAVKFRAMASDSRSRLWLAGPAPRLTAHEDATGAWFDWPLPSGAGGCVDVAVDAEDCVWLAIEGGGALRFDPTAERFETVPTGAPIARLAAGPSGVWALADGGDLLLRL
jgi:virginiamycin B lyase